MKRLLVAVAAVTLSSSFALADSSSAMSVILALRGSSAPPTTMTTHGLQSWSFGSVASLALQAVILRQGLNINSTTSTINNPADSHVSVTQTVIQNSSALGGFHY